VKYAQAREHAVATANTPANEPRMIHALQLNSAAGFDHRSIHRHLRERPAV